MSFIVASGETAGFGSHAAGVGAGSPALGAAMDAGGEDVVRAAVREGAAAPSISAAWSAASALANGSSRSTFPASSTAETSHVREDGRPMSSAAAATTHSVPTTTVLGARAYFVAAPCVRLAVGRAACEAVRVFAPARRGVTVATIFRSDALPEV
jgi:hypothetical protein